MTGDSRLDHLARMSDETGLFEHAKGAAPRLEHGYCTDDNARLLVVATRQAGSDPVAAGLSRLALRFLEHAQDHEGRVHNRLLHGRGWQWSDAAGTQDWWGRAVWGLGVAASAHPDADVRERALAAFRRSAVNRSPFPHSMTFAVLGAAEVLAARPEEAVARRLLEDAKGQIGGSGTASWPWPQPRLTYASAAMAEAMVAIGAALADRWALRRGLSMLDWLVDLQVREEHLSVVGVGGRGPDDRAPQFDQQPIEVAALADAAWRAWTATGEARWREAVLLAADWFEGANDVGAMMHDPATGGGYDGLTPQGPNVNQGAESTMAFISTMQRARAVRSVSVASAG